MPYGGIVRVLRTTIVFALVLIQDLFISRSASPKDIRQNDQKNFGLSFRAKREILCFEDIPNAQDFSLRSK